MEIVEFRPEHAGAFRRLNEAWISQLFALEAKDREVLEHPQEKILDPGGKIFMALEAGEPVGCVAPLAPALALYRAMGFKALAPQATEYSRCDVWMERRLP